MHHIWENDDLVVIIMNLASKPLPWPWNACFLLLNKKFMDLCHKNQRRDWYIRHSSIVFLDQSGRVVPHREEDHPNDNHVAGWHGRRRLQVKNIKNLGARQTGSQ